MDIVQEPDGSVTLANEKYHEGKLRPVPLREASQLADTAQVSEPRVSYCHSQRLICLPALPCALSALPPPVPMPATPPATVPRQITSQVGQGQPSQLRDRRMHGWQQ